jgi:hypothetical protein
MVHFLGRASVAVAATRDAELVPHTHFVCGWSVDEDQESLVCLIPEGFTEDLVESLEDNGQLALTAEVIGPHETYQFKGSYVDSRPARASDRALAEACSERFVRAVRQAYGDRFSEADLRGRFRDPALAVRFRVREIFVQTPGPSAGQRLFPREK